MAKPTKIKLDPLVTQTENKKAITAAYKAVKPKPSKYKKGVTKNDYLLVINIPDLHLGKYAWAGETGEDYDIPIAKARFLGAIQDALDKTKHLKIGRILFTLGSDYFNTDTIANTTTAGTPQDCDGRWQRLLQEGWKLAVKGVLMCEAVAPVDIVMVQGNHDWANTYALGQILEAYFQDHPNVTLDNSANPQKYYRWRKVGFFIVHGDKRKMTDLPMVFANDNPSLWGHCTSKYILTGHLHHEKKVAFKIMGQDSGCFYYQFGSLSGTDAYHKASGYIGTKRSQSLVFGPDSTEYMTTTFTVL